MWPSQEGSRLDKSTVFTFSSDPKKYPNLWPKALKMEVRCSQKPLWRGSKKNVQNMCHFLSPLGSKCGPKWSSTSVFFWGFWCSWPSLGPQGSQSGFWEPKWSPGGQNGRQNFVQWHQLSGNCSFKKRAHYPLCSNMPPRGVKNRFPMLQKKGHSTNCIKQETQSIVLWVLVS